MHFDRRSLFGAAATAALIGRGASAKLPAGSDVEPRGTTGILERLPTLDLEASEEFFTTFRTWVNGEFSQAARASAERTIRAKGKDPKAEMTQEEAIDLLKDDPMVLMRVAMWQRMQMHSWNNIKREFHDNYDAYMSEMEAADKAGPGTLELNPDMHHPDYTRHEVHMQPGGFVGDPFAGHLYHYLTNNFREGGNYQDELHTSHAAAAPLPADGKVRRVLEIGCGIGRLTLAMKRRFPNAEVWGIDIGAPLVRYGHMRAVDLGIDVNFAHRLAEDSKFPDNHFDIVTSFILHHEASAEASRQIVKEVHRILRPGGLYYPIDLYTGVNRKPNKTAWGRFNDWVQLRWNHEPWWLEYRDLDFEGALSNAGFEVSPNGPPAYAGDKANIVATKRA